jgi:protein phosphatase PTC7
MIPHPEKAHFGGEDSYFISRDNNVIGVADGVSGSAKRGPGADPAFWSNDIMRRCAASVNAGSPREILLQAVSGVNSKIQGSTTVSIAQLANNVLDVYIVGDSGLAVFRDGEIVRRARETVSSFNCPYQVGSSGVEHAREGAGTRILVRKGDVVVLASDGLWDNFPCEEIAKVLSVLREEEEDEEFVMAAAETLAETASRNGADPRYQSPFELKAKEAGRTYTGGKPDDVAVVVALVVEKTK